MKAKVPSEEWGTDLPLFLDVVAATALLLPVPELVGVAGTNDRSQDSSKESTSPSEFVTANVGHWNGSGGGSVMVTVLVKYSVFVVVVVDSVAVQGAACRGRRAALGVKVARPDPRIILAKTEASSVGLLDADVVLGATYESMHSVSSSSIPPSLLVTVIGGQLNSVASSGSSTSMAVLYIVQVVVVVNVLPGSQSWQRPSEPQ